MIFGKVSGTEPVVRKASAFSGNVDLRAFRRYNK